jgi:hypothetical protein
MTVCQYFQLGRCKFGGIHRLTSWMNVELDDYSNNHQNAANMSIPAKSLLHLEIPSEPYSRALLKAPLPSEVCLQSYCIKMLLLLPSRGLNPSSSLHKVLFFSLFFLNITMSFMHLYRTSIPSLKARFLSITIYHIQHLLCSTATSIKILEYRMSIFCSQASL